MAFYGGDMFVGDFWGSRVEELDISSGALLKVIERLSTGTFPAGMALFGDYLFVADCPAEAPGSPGRVTELRA
jgi:hypothetical protein